MGLYTGTSKETHPLTEEIATKLKANVYYARLTGHGEPKEYFATTKASDWAQDTLEAWEIGRAIGEDVIIIGTSTGATLATWLALTHEVKELKALVFVSPNYGVADPTASVLLMPWGVQIAELISGGPYHPWEPCNEDQGKYWMTSPSVKATTQMTHLVAHVDSMDMSRMR